MEHPSRSGTHKMKVSVSTHDVLIFSHSCGIADPRQNFLYLTGNYIYVTDDTYKGVTKYGAEGYLEDLPLLNIGRAYHACAGYYDTHGHFVLVVVGGMGMDIRTIGALSSTETFTVGVSTSWKQSEPLPEELFDLRAATVDNQIFLFGRKIIHQYVFSI